MIIRFSPDVSMEKARVSIVHYANAAVFTALVHFAQIAIYDGSEYCRVLFLIRENQILKNWLLIIREAMQKFTVGHLSITIAIKSINFIISITYVNFSS